MAMINQIRVMKMNEIQYALKDLYKCHLVYKILFIKLDLQNNFHKVITEI